MKAVQQYLDMAYAIGVADAGHIGFVIPPIPEASEARVSALLSDVDARKPLVAVAPFTRWDSKHWIEAYWTQLIGQLLENGCTVAVLGGPDDQTHGEKILGTHAQHPHLKNLIGQTGLVDLYALFTRTDVLIGLDSAPLHIANAVGRAAIVGIFGPTAAGRTGPIGFQHVALTTKLDCQPCFAHECPLGHHNCMRELTPEIVLKEALERLPAGVRG